MEARNCMCNGNNRCKAKQSTNLYANKIQQRNKQIHNKNHKRWGLWGNSVSLLGIRKPPDRPRSYHRSHSRPLPRSNVAVALNSIPTSNFQIHHVYDVDPQFLFFFSSKLCGVHAYECTTKMLLFEVCIVPSALCPPSAANSMLSHVVFSYILNDRTSNKSKWDNGWAYTNVNRAESIFFSDLAHITDCFSTGGLYWTEVHFEHLESALTTLT